MSLNHHLPKKISLVPKKHHGFQFVLFLLGVLLPPLAVAARFGIGTDLLINTILCICGYFPCHFHNFYIQNIRNNTNRARTPKWALKAGLVDNTETERRKAKNAWSKRFDERNNQSAHVGQELEEGEEGANYVPDYETEEARERRRNEGLWTGDDEEYYGEDRDRARNQQHWHYPANFEGTVGDGRSKSRKTASSNGDRWERTRSRTDSYSSGSYPSAAAADADVPEWGKDYGSKKKDKKKSKKGGTASSWADNNYVQDVQRDDGWGGARTNSARSGSMNGGGGYGGYDDEPRRTNGSAIQSGGAQKPKKDIFEHEF